MRIWIKTTCFTFQTHAGENGKQINWIYIYIYHLAWCSKSKCPSNWRFQQHRKPSEPVQLPSRFRLSSVFAVVALSAHHTHIHVNRDPYVERNEMKWKNKNRTYDSVIKLHLMSKWWTSFLLPIEECIWKDNEYNQGLGFCVCGFGYVIDWPPFTLDFDSYRREGISISYAINFEDCDIFSFVVHWMRDEVRPIRATFDWFVYPSVACCFTFPYTLLGHSFSDCPSSVCFA